jgi:calcineurin-like phosphoesterase family protein
MIYYTSDLHAFHKNIITYCNRPFKDVEDMNYQLIKRWNERVTPNDIIYHLGDFGFTSGNKLDNFASQLNGKEKYTILGNHDKKVPTGFIEIPNCYSIYDSGYKIILCHYGLRVWEKSHHGALHLYGHSHGSLPGDSQSLDVGVDCWNWYPVALPDILKRMKTLPKRNPVDHHGAM